MAVSRHQYRTDTNCVADMRMHCGYLTMCLPALQCTGIVVSGHNSSYAMHKGSWLAVHVYAPVLRITTLAGVHDYQRHGSAGSASKRRLALFDPERFGLAV